MLVTYLGRVSTYLKLRPVLSREGIAPRLDGDISDLNLSQHQAPLKYSQTRNPNLHTVPHRQQANAKDQEDHNASRLLIHLCFANGSIVRRATSYIVQHHQCKPRSRQGEMGGISLSHDPQIHPTIMLVRPRQCLTWLVGNSPRRLMCSSRCRRPWGRDGICNRHMARLVCRQLSMTKPTGTQVQHSVAFSAMLAGSSSR